MEPLDSPNSEEAERLRRSAGLVDKGYRGPRQPELRYRAFLNDRAPKTPPKDKKALQRDRERRKRSYRMADPERRARVKAREKVGDAIKSGKLRKQPCVSCGSTERLEAHHTDYTQPLNVTWLCKPCHDAETFQKGRKHVVGTHDTPRISRPNKAYVPGNQKGWNTLQRDGMQRRVLQHPSPGPQALQQPRSTEREGADPWAEGAEDAG